MKITSKIIFSLSFILICLSVKAQEIKNVETLLVNEWTLKSYEVNGQVFPPRERNKNDKMIFNLDKSA